MSGTSRISCSCPDWLYHGQNLTLKRLERIIKAAKGVTVQEGQEQGEYLAYTTVRDIHQVYLSDEGSISKIDKHCLAVLWYLGIEPFIVRSTDLEWGIPRIEIRTDRYLSNPKVATSLIAETDIISITPIRKED